MSLANGSAVIGNDLVVKGDLRSSGRIEVHGLVEGKVNCEHLTIHPTGRVLGSIDVGSADINGTLRGRTRVRNTIAIGSTGKVEGDVRYGRIAMVDGAELAADVRNIPPELGGDFQIVVRRGRSVTVTTADIDAVDPDNSADELTYKITAPSQGHLARTAFPSMAIDNFTQAELAAGKIVFVHNGNGTGSGSFDVTVADASGNESGAPITVTVAVV